MMEFLVGVLCFVCFFLVILIVIVFCEVQSLRSRVTNLEQYRDWLGPQLQKDFTNVYDQIEKLKETEVKITVSR